MVLHEQALRILTINNRVASSFYGDVAAEICCDRLVTKSQNGIRTTMQYAISSSPPYVELLRPVFPQLRIGRRTKLTPTCGFTTIEKESEIAEEHAARGQRTAAAFLRTH